MGIPDYLAPFVVEQDSSLYTAIDHASWRFILKISRGFFATHAHQKYLDGLRETGISTDRIPKIEEMDACLQRFGWRAAAVSGFIPPGVFMEFLSLGVLPIACDMRQLDHLDYTPAPDIVHEAAGHAPIIADPEYREYLREYGEISRKAIFSAQDQEVYNAVRELSDKKEDPAASPADIAQAQNRLDEALAAVSHDSESALLSRMAWWTFEYGLVGDPKDPKIYGAGLLSSLSESFHFLDPSVKKVPFSLDCTTVSYDITRPQPQLFVAPDFRALSHFLKTLGETMAYRRGGVEGLEKAKRARTVCTVTLDSGVQISGQLADFLTDADGAPAYLKFQGPVQLARDDVEVAKQGAGYHLEGYSTPLGPVKSAAGDWLESAGSLSDGDLRELGFVAGRKGKIEFKSGVTLEGELKKAVRDEARALILTFHDCTVKQDETLLFSPAWGIFDLACGGAKILSVFGGAADRRAYLAVTGGYQQRPGRQKSNLTEGNRALNALYAEVRAIREKGATERDAKRISEIAEELEKLDSQDWLLCYELLELGGGPWAASMRARLDRIAASDPKKGEMIRRGCELLGGKA